MDILIQSQKTKSRILLAVLGIIILLIIFNIGRGLFSENGSSQDGIFIVSSEKANIDFNILENEELDNLDEFKEPPPFSGKQGKANPFLP